jgi:radical SAM-linked protein
MDTGHEKSGYNHYDEERSDCDSSGKRMQANYVQRLRLTFSKDGPARYIGHLDLARTMERSLNRAQIPIAYSQGFNRRPRLSFAAALPLGYTSEYELADIWLFEELDPRRVIEQMMQRMAPGIILTAVKEVSLGAPSLQSKTASARYLVTPLNKLSVMDLSNRVDQLLAEKHLVRERKSGKGKIKQYDLRPLIIDLDSDADAFGKGMLKMTLFLMPGKTGRPDEILDTLEIDPLAAHVHRTLITLLDDNDP